MYLFRHGESLPHYHVFRGEPPDLRSVRGIVSDARSLSGRGLIQRGLLVLIATPIARVVFSIVGFLRQRDWTYVVISLVVLALLSYSLASGWGRGKTAAQPTISPSRSATNTLPSTIRSVVGMIAFDVRADSHDHVWRVRRAMAME